MVYQEPSLRPRTCSKVSFILRTRALYTSCAFPGILAPNRISKSESKFWVFVALEMPSKLRVNLPYFTVTCITPLKICRFSSSKFAWWQGWAETDFEWRSRSQCKDHGKKAVCINHTCSVINVVNPHCKLLRTSRARWWFVELYFNTRCYRWK